MIGHERCNEYYEGCNILDSILEQLGVKDVIKRHLRYAIHQDVPVTFKVYGPIGQHGMVIGVEFSAVVSSDHRLQGSFRWPTDDHWVRIIKGQMAMTLDELTRSRGTATQIALARVHACGVEMTKQVPQYVETADVMEEGMRGSWRDES